MSSNNIEADPKLLRIKGEFLLLKEKLTKAELSLAETDAKLAELATYLQATEKGEPLPDEAFATLGIPKGSEWQGRMLLKIRLLGMIKRTKTERQAVERNIGAMKEALENLYICPDCGGLGTLYGQRKYERLEEGPIIPSADYKTCSLCGGKGRITISI